MSSIKGHQKRLAKKTADLAACGKREIQGDWCGPKAKCPGELVPAKRRQKAGATRTLCNVRSGAVPAGVVAWRDECRLHQTVGPNCFPNGICMKDYISLWWAGTNVAPGDGESWFNCQEHQVRAQVLPARA